MSFLDQEHEDYRDVVSEFVHSQVKAEYERWESTGHIDTEFWQVAAQTGLLGLDIPAEYGGMGITDFRYRLVMFEELAKVGASALAVAIAAQEDLFIPLLKSCGTEEQKAAWFPDLAEGNTVGAVALTDPAAGSDLKGIRTMAVPCQGGWKISGQKTFVSNGGCASLIIVAAKTSQENDPNAVSLFMVESSSEGLEKGKPIQKVGLHAAETVELFFTNCFVPETNILGTIGSGLFELEQPLAQLRLSLAAYSWAASAAALRWTEEYVSSRIIFGQRLMNMQNTRFILADIESRIDVIGAYIEHCVSLLNEQQLTKTVAAKAKLRSGENYISVVSELLQLFGGYGYTEDYLIGRAYRDCRIQTIFGGTSEIMKEIIGRAMSDRQKSSHYER